MADKDARWPDNAPGRYYVDEECIDCDLCREICPECFAYNEEEGHSFVCAQPANPEQEERCAEALESCPVGAIGDDGQA